MEVPAELAVRLDGYVESSGDNVQTPSVWNQITIQSVIVKREQEHINQLLNCDGLVLFYSDRSYTDLNLGRLDYDGMLCKAGYAWVRFNYDPYIAHSGYRMKLLWRKTLEMI
jgi:hypothetical protein